MMVVAVAAAALSFASLANLADRSGITTAWTLGRTTVHAAWLLPVVVDAYALVATRVWLRPDRSIADRTRAYARANALAAVAASCLGNAVDHAMCGRSGPAVVLAVAVAWVPPAALGLVAHLYAMVSADRSARPVVPTKPSAPAQKPTERPKMDRPTGRTPKSGPTDEALIRAARDVLARQPTLGRDGLRAALGTATGYRPGAGRTARILMKARAA